MVYGADVANECIQFLSEITDIDPYLSLNLNTLRSKSSDVRRNNLHLVSGICYYERVVSPVIMG